ncbi:MAG: hypothetical protein LC793_25070 [Thermomicrobia bacterium]|nr:hypothetical protein [Thermomicrobia bacterium]
MTIQIVHKDGRDYPQVFCDQCGEPITTTEQAAYAWYPHPLEPELIPDAAIGRKPGRPDFPPSPVLFFHLPQCMDDHEQVVGAFIHWIPLSVFCEYLQNNLGLDTVAKRTEMNKRARAYGSI